MYELRSYVSSIVCVVSFLSLAVTIPPELFCPSNEEFTKCVSLCNDCHTKGFCEQNFCDPGCDCIEGYYRDLNGVCIPSEHCQTHSCPRNEELTDCVIPCNDCEMRGKCEFLICNVGCDCLDGYYRNDHLQCIPEHQCPSHPISLSCPHNQEFYECIPCHNTCEEYSFGISCDYCSSGCHCREGLVKDYKGNCIKPDHCPLRRCGLNEEYSHCVVPCNTCELRGRCQFINCSSGCDCKPGFHRDLSGVCIEEANCPKERCGLNEEYSFCVNPCGTCSDRHDCKFDDCHPGCDCKPGFLRNESLACIPEEKCPFEIRCSYDQQYYPCAPYCTNTCKNFFNPDAACTKICQPGCFCKRGLLMNSRGQCVDPQNCDNTKCGPDETFYSCKPTCENTCEYRYPYYFNSDYQCSDICTPGCFCRPGLLLRKDGKCIRPNDCIQQQCRPGEKFYGCMPTCNNTCENYNKPNQPCFFVCKSGCFCEEGLVKKKDGKCVVPTECDGEVTIQSRCRNRDETFYLCMPDCKNTCENHNRSDAVCPAICNEGCFCRRGLVKSKEGNCVRPSQCPTVPISCGENEEFSTCGPCQRTCENLGKNIACAAVCIEGCFCKDGFVKNENRICVRPSECPQNECMPDETFYLCIPDCKNTCENHNRSVHCRPICRKGCFCREGLVKSKEGRCVRPSECETIRIIDECNPDEQLYPCIPDCKNTCENHNRSIHCRPLCRAGCFCREGLVKSKEGKCVTPSECPIERCKPDEQFYSCIPDCKNTCENHNRSIHCFPLCREGCFCREGMVKSKEGKCVTPSECPIVPIPCGLNEEFSTCGPCEKTCETLGKDVMCTFDCKVGCFCKHRFARNEFGVCVRTFECPQKITCKPDESLYDCIPDCRNTCENLNKPDLICTAECRKGCFCREGLVKQRDGACVLPSRCRFECTDNEEFVECGCTRTCNRVTILNCEAQCIRGCFCKQGFVKSREGKCIPVTECEKELNCNADEQFYPCMPDCSNSCENHERPGITCERCNPGCFCKPGLVKRKDGKCVVPNNCNLDQCRSDETFYECKPDCRNTCENFRKPNRICPTTCNKGCFCRPGLVLREDGKCVLPLRCERTCRSDEHYFICMPECINTCSNFQNPDNNCPRRCRPGCFCNQGLVLRNTDKRCMPFSLCGLLGSVLGRSGDQEASDVRGNASISAMVSKISTSVSPTTIRSSTTTSKPSTKQQQGRLLSMTKKPKRTSKVDSVDFPDISGRSRHEEEPEKAKPSEVDVTTRTKSENVSSFGSDAVNETTSSFTEPSSTTMKNESQEISTTVPTTESLSTTMSTMKITVQPTTRKPSSRGSGRSSCRGPQRGGRRKKKGPRRGRLQPKVRPTTKKVARTTVTASTTVQSATAASTTAASTTAASTTAASTTVQSMTAASTPVQSRPAVRTFKEELNSTDFPDTSSNSSVNNTSTESTTTATSSLNINTSQPALLLDSSVTNSNSRPNRNITNNTSTVTTTTQSITSSPTAKVTTDFNGFDFDHTGDSVIGSRGRHSGEPIKPKRSWKPATVSTVSTTEGLNSSTMLDLRASPAETKLEESQTITENVSRTAISDSDEKGKATNVITSAVITPVPSFPKPLKQEFGNDTVAITPEVTQEIVPLNQTASSDGESITTTTSTTKLPKREGKKTERLVEASTNQTESANITLSISTTPNVIDTGVQPRSLQDPMFDDDDSQPAEKQYNSTTDYTKSSSSLDEATSSITSYNTSGYPSNNAYRSYQNVTSKPSSTTITKPMTASATNGTYSSSGYQKNYQGTQRYNQSSQSESTDTVYLNAHDFIKNSTIKEKGDT